MMKNSQVARLTLAGLELGIGVALGAVAGMYLDQKFDTEPWLMLAGLTLGVASGFLNLYRLVVAADKNNGDAGRREKP